GRTPHLSRFINFEMPNIYILKSLSGGSYYVGCCKDLSKRFNQHNAGLVKSTKRSIPWEIVYEESYGTLSMARIREKEIKSWKKRSSIEKLIGISKF
ncbi:MAG: GIY-YIG nuclease family protein, partial [bacterium]|nr:GIY-YIG nuclease family protein [bacterium]